MNSFWRIFWLEWTAIVRTKTLALLTAASVGWMYVSPYVLKGDGTAEGAREICIRYSLGGVFLLVTVALLAGATGSLARERAARRLQLTMVRPVSYMAIALGKMLAYVAAGAMVLAVAFVMLGFRVNLSQRCDHVISPILPSPAEEALTMYDSYMADPDTPDAIRRAKKSVVLRILRQRALDHYQTMPTNEVVSWRFAECEPRAVRIRFTNMFEMRQSVEGAMSFGEWRGAVSNITQAVVEVPLRRAAVDGTARPGELVFSNQGKHALMIRPRKDISLLVAGDEFWRNAIRAYLEMVAVLALVIAFGTFLSAGLGRPVALFTAIVMMIVGEMSPSVVEQYPDELEGKLADRIGLYITRATVAVTKPLTALTPLDALSKNEFIERPELLRTLAVDAVAMPLVLALLSALILPRKQEEI